VGEVVTNPTTTYDLRPCLGDVAEIDGRIARVITINEGQRDITFEFVGSQPCPTCGKPDRVSINYGTPLWDQRVFAVKPTGNPVPPLGRANL
jgi:hypothetical protein